MAEVINIATFEFDLEKLNKSLDDYQKRLFELQKEQKRYASQSKALDTQMRNLTEAKQLLANAGQKESKAYKDVESQIKSVNAQQEQLFKNQRNLQIETGKVRAEYNRATKAQQAMRDSMGNLLSSTEAYEQALKREVKTKEDAKKSTAELIKLGDQLDLTNDENVKTLELINKKIDENTEFLKANSSQMQQQRMNIGNYESALKNAVMEINIFNGGLTGFATRAAQAGGAGALLTNSLKTATSATMGLTKAMLAFLVSPIGIVLGVIAGAFLLLQNAMKRSEDSTNKLKAAIAPLSGLLSGLMKILQPIGDFLIDGVVVGFEMVNKAVEMFIGHLVWVGQNASKILKAIGLDTMAGAVDVATKGVSEFGKSMIQAGKDAKELALAEQELAKAERNLELIREKAETDAEKQRQIRDDLTKSDKERMKANEELGRIQLKQLQDEKVILAERLRIEKERLNNLGATAERTESVTKAEIALAALENRITGQRSEQLRNQVSLQKEAHDRYMAQIDAQITKQKEQLDLWILQQGDRAKTLQEQLDLDRQIAQKSIAILDQELKAKKISREKYEAEVLKIRMDLSKSEAEIIVENAQLELNEFLKTQEKIISERKRLNGEELALIAQQEAAKLAFELTRFEQGLINETEYQANKLSIQEEFLNKERDLRNQFSEQQRADDQYNRTLEFEQKMLQLQEQNASEFELELERIAFENEQRNLVLDEQFENEQISEENYLLAKEILRRQNAEAEKAIEFEKEQAIRSVYAQTFGGIAKLLGEKTALGKAAAIAEATMNTWAGVNQVWASQSILPEPFATIQKGVSTGVVIASGLNSVKKITSVKTPKGGGGGGGISNPEIQGFAGGGVVEDGDPIFRANGDNVLITARTGEAILNESQRGFIGNDILNMAGVPNVLPSDNLSVQNYATGNSEGLTEIIADAVYRGSLLGTSSGAESGLVQANENRMVQNQASF